MATRRRCAAAAAVGRAAAVRCRRRAASDRRADRLLRLGRCLRGECQQQRGEQGTDGGRKSGLGHRRCGLRGTTAKECGEGNATAHRLQPRRSGWSWPVRKPAASAVLLLQQIGQCAEKPLNAAAGRRCGPGVVGAAHQIGVARVLVVVAVRAQRLQLLPSGGLLSWLWSRWCTVSSLQVDARELARSARRSTDTASAPVRGNRPRAARGPCVPRRPDGRSLALSGVVFFRLMAAALRRGRQGLHEGLTAAAIVARAGRARRPCSPSVPASRYADRSPADCRTRVDARSFARTFPGTAPAARSHAGRVRSALRCLRAAHRRLCADALPFLTAILWD